MSAGVFGSRLPIVCAPMAGGPSSPGLVCAVAEAGGFAFLAAGYLRAEVLREQIVAVREHGLPFGVNLFVPSPVSDASAAVREQLAGFAAEIAEDAAAVGVSLPDVAELPLADSDDWEAKLRVLEELPVPVVSFTFGLPPAAVVERVRGTGAKVLATVTSVVEARAAFGLAIDGLIVQGAAAGGHSAMFDPSGEVTVAASVAETVDLVRDVAGLRDAVAPGAVLLAAGGVDGPGAVSSLLDAGASGVVSGTLFLTAFEAGTNNVHRAALAGGLFSETVVTRAFTGRPARALLNGFARRHSDSAPVAYPAVHFLTSGMRKAAVGSGVSDLVHLWAGAGFRSARELPAAEIVEWLVADIA